MADKRPAIFGRASKWLKSQFTSRPHQEPKNAEQTEKPVPNGRQHNPVDLDGITTSSQSTTKSDLASPGDQPVARDKDKEPRNKPDILDSKLNEAILNGLECQYKQEVVRALNELNKWKLNLKIWYLEQRIGLKDSPEDAKDVPVVEDTVSDAFDKQLPEELKEGVRHEQILLPPNSESIDSEIAELNQSGEKDYPNALEVEVTEVSSTKIDLPNYETSSSDPTISDSEQEEQEMEEVKSKERDPKVFIFQTSSGSSEGELEQLSRKVFLLKDCLAEYEAIYARSKASTAEPENPSADTSLHEVSFRERLYNFPVASEFDNNELDDNVFSNDLSQDSPYLQFQETFRHLLEDKYGHLPEKILFGKPVQGESQAMLLNDFKNLDDCSELENYKKFFSEQFPSPSMRKMLDQLLKSFVLIFSDKSNNWNAEQFHRQVYDDITTYCYYLIDSRVETMEVFEQFERALHESLVSYDFLSTKIPERTKNKLSKLLTAISKLKIDYDKCNRSHLAYTPAKRRLYQRQIKLYTHILSVLRRLQWVKTDEIEKCFESSNNHYSYLHEHVCRLGTLLSPLLQRYSTSRKDREDCHIFTIKMDAGTFSGALSALKDELSVSDTQLNEGDEIRLCAVTALYGDRDIDGEEFQGVNIGCFAPKLEVHFKKHRKLQITTDGKLLEDTGDPDPAASGQPGTEDNKDGKTGLDGDNGDYGNAGGHILLVSNNLSLDDFHLSANGSQGQSGQDGGDGGDGWSATEEGKDGESPKFTPGRLHNKDAVIINYGTYGQDGGKGGDAGMGGAAGKAGVSGDIELLDLEKGPVPPVEAGVTGSPKVRVDVKDGDVGDPGEGGRNTRHGKDYGAYAKSLGFGSRFVTFLFTGERPEDSIEPIKGGLTHPDIPDEPYSGNHYERPDPGVKKATALTFKGIPHQRKGESHPDFKSRGSNRRGDKATCKVNTAVAKFNKAIDKQSCFQAMHQQYDESLQHWNAKSHNQFLKAFADRIREAHQDTFVALTHSEIIKTNSAVWIARIQKLSETTQASVTKHTRQTVKAEVHLMKDFDDDDRHTSMGYLGCDAGDSNRLSLNLLPLRVRAEQNEPPIDLGSITEETLLMSEEHDDFVKEIFLRLGLSENEFVLVCCNSKKTELSDSDHEFLITEDNGNYYYHHNSHSEVPIEDEPIIDLLREYSSRGERDFMLIEREEVFYPKVIKWVYDKCGHTAPVPCTSEQLHCIQQLKLIIEIRKAYNVVGGKCMASPDCYQVVQKMYAHCLDELLSSKSLESLAVLEQDLLSENLLFVPIDVDWIATGSSKVNLSNTVNAYNKKPTSDGLLNVIVQFHDYHMAQFKKPQTRETYLKHLTTDISLYGLQTFYSQICVSLRMFCDEDQIHDSFQSIPSVASSEILLQNISLQMVDSEANETFCRHVLAMVCEQQSAVYTVMDTFLDSLADYIGTDMPSRKVPRSLPDDLTFKESYAAFQSHHSIQTVLPALSMYAKHCCINDKPTITFLEELEDVLAYVYETLRLFLGGFHPQRAHVDFLSELDDVGLNVDDLLQKMKLIVVNVNKDHPLLSEIKAMVHLVKRFHELVVFGTSVNEEEIDPSTSLTSVPLFLTDLGDFCKQREEVPVEDLEQMKMLIDGINEAVVECTDSIEDIYKTLCHFPMLSPAPALHAWKETMEHCANIYVYGKIRHFRNSDPDVCDKLNLSSLKSVLEKTITGFESLAKLVSSIEWIVRAENLKQYSAILNVEEHATHHDMNLTKAKLFTQYSLSLDEVFHSSRCMDTLTKWLCPGLKIHPTRKVTVNTERLVSQYQLVIRTQGPKVDERFEPGTVILFPNAEEWQLCVTDHVPGESVPSLQFRYVTELIAEVDNDIMEKIKKLDVLTDEEKAHILDKLNYEDEFNIRHRVWFYDQLLIDENNVPFSLLSIDMKTCLVRAHRDPYVKHIRNDDVMIVQCRFTSDATGFLRSLGITDEQLSSFKDKPAISIVKHPGLPAIIRSVTNCGEEAFHDFSYTIPLITDLSDEGEFSYSEQLQPLSTLLNGYHSFYQTLLPFEALNTALDIAVKKSLYHMDVAELVREIRRKFVWRCVSDNTNSHDSENIQTMQHSLAMILSSTCDHPDIEDICLTGLESYVYFLLARRNRPSKRRFFGFPRKANKKETTNERESDHFLRWSQVLDKRSVTPEDAKCLFLTFAYLEGPKRIDVTLHDQTVSIRFQTYKSIRQGLDIFHTLFIAKKNEKFSVASSLSTQIEDLTKDHQIEALQEASFKLEDDRNVWSLLSLIISIDPLKQELLKIAKNTLTEDPEACLDLLQAPEFYKEIYLMVLRWCNDQQEQLVKAFQLKVSLPIFAQNAQKETFINTLSFWMIDKTESLLKEHDWESLETLYEIGDVLLGALESDVEEIQFSRETEYTDVLSNLLTVVQVLDASSVSDVADILSIVQTLPHGQWLLHLLAQNILTVYEEHYGVSSVDDIRDKLLSIDPKLLQITYNVFIDDQYNRESEESTIGVLSLDQLKTILDWLPFVEQSSDAYSTLCSTAMSLWEKELAEIHFKQYLDHWDGMTNADKKRLTYLMNRVRLDAGIGHLEFMAFLSTIKSSSTCKDSRPLVDLFEDLYYKRFTVQQAKRIILAHKYEQWSTQFQVLKMPEREQYTPRNAKDILELIKMQLQRGGDYDKSLAEFETIEQEAEQIAQSFIDVDSDKPQTSEEELKKYFSVLERRVTVTDKLQWLKQHRVEFLIHLVKAWMLVTFRSGRMQVPYNTQMVSLLLFLHTDNCGLLQQVKTGEGKTLIVGMLAAAKALLGFHVDVVSSNRDLAQDGVKKCQPFFRALGLQAAENCTDDGKTNRQAYKSHIVYGDVGSFQRDVLTEETEPGGSAFSTRYSDMQKNCLLVDEVDSMFLDKGRHMLYISHESPALKHLEFLFLNIWSAVLSIHPKENESIDILLNKKAVELNVLIQRKTIAVPEYLTEFCRHKMLAWVHSAYQARFMDADDQFILDTKSSKDSSEAKQIFPIDKQTGIEQYNMKWSNGLSQFLELKYRRAISTESLKAVFISNKRFFNLYGKQLYGLTGTLGSTASRGLLREIYGVCSVELPTNIQKRYTQHKSRVAKKSIEWCEQIHEEITERNNDQPVLVICENIKQLNTLKDHLKRESIDEQDIIDYARDGDDVEERFRESGASPGQIVLATNKGGRGTDIIIRDGGVPKGLHVIVSFLPENTRIEEQAFGRAARAGQAGSGCLILQIDPSEYEDEIEVFGTTGAATETLIEIEKIKRDQTERDRISLLLSEGIPQLDLEEKLYQLFQTHRKSFESSLNDATLLDGKVSGEPKTAIIAILTDRWAYWLESVRGEIQAADSQKKREVLIAKFSEKFSCPVMCSPSYCPDFKLFKKPEHCIKLGQAYVKEEKYASALTCFELGIARGDRTGVAAMTACYCYIKGHSEPDKEKKNKVRRYLKKMKTHLEALKQSWMANGEVGKSLGDLIDVKQYVEGEENHYSQQIEEKLKVIGLHLNTIDSLLGNVVNETSFMRESTLKDEELKEEHSKSVYQKLSESGIICQHKVRKCWKKREVLEPLFTKDVEPRIAGDLIEIILQNPTINENDLTGLVYSSDGVWDLLRPLMAPIEKAMLLKVSLVDAKLQSDDLKKSWETLRYKFNHRLGGICPLVLTTSDPIHQELQRKECKGLVEHLQVLEKPLYFESRRAKQKSDGCDLVLSLKLKNYEINDDRYLYQHMLPFDSETQAELWDFLSPLLESSETVTVLQLSQIKAQLTTDDLVRYWEELTDEFPDRLKCSNFTQLLLLENDPIHKRLQKRVFEELATHLRDNFLYFESRRGNIKGDKVTSLELERYELKTPQGERYVYKHLLPFDHKAQDNVWEFLSPILEPTETITVLKVSHVDAQLTDDLVQSWEKLGSKFHCLKSQLVLLSNDPIRKELEKEEFKDLATHLENKALYCESKHGALKAEACDLLLTLDLGKYEHCRDGTLTLRESLKQMFSYCIACKEGYFYEYMLPFDGQTQEAKKLHVFLQEQEILKSGVLSKHEYDSDDDKLESSVKKAIGKGYTKEQRTFIVSKVRGLRGEVRGFKRKMVVGFVDFYDLKDRPEDIPETLDFFTSWHLDHFLTLEQADKGWWDWNAFAVAMLGLAQVIAGVLLVTFTAGIGAQIGAALISEGINDMVYATIAGLTGTFSWKDWAIQKAISVAISIVTGGLGALAAPLKVAAKVGSAARYSTFAKTMAKAAGEFALQATAGVLSDIVLADVQERVVKAIVEEIRKKMFSQMKESLKSRLTRMAANAGNPDDFHRQCKDIVKNFEKSLGSNPTIPKEFDQFRSSVVSSLKQNSKKIANKLSKSNSKWAKVAGASVKAALIANQVYTVVNAGLKTGQAVEALVSLVGVGEQSSEEHSHSDVDEALVQRELDDIEKCFQDYIQQQIQQKLKRSVDRVIKGSLKQAAQASKNVLSGKVEKALNGKASQAVKHLQEKTQAVVSDHDEHPRSKSSPSEKTSKPKPSTQARKKRQAYQKRRKTFQHTIIKPKKEKTKNKKTASKVKKSQAAKKSQETHKKANQKGSKNTSQAAKRKLPETHGHRSDNLATGYSQDRRTGTELERMPQRVRAASQGNLTDNSIEQVRTRRRAYTNCLHEKQSETRQPSRARTDSHARLPKKNKTNYKARVDPKTYKQTVATDGKEVTTEYSQKDGLSVKSTETYHEKITGKVNANGELTADNDVRLTSLKMTVKGAQFGKGRAPVTKPLTGMIDRNIAANDGETKRQKKKRKMIDTEVTGHGAPGSAGVNAGEGLATSVIKSPSYNYQEKPIWEGDVRKKISDKKFQVDVDIKLGPVTIDNPKQWIERVNEARKIRYKEKNGKGSEIPKHELVDTSNAKALQERMQLFHDKDPRMHRVESFKAVYKSEDGETVYNPNCKGLGPDLELGIPKRFNQPNQPAELKHTATVNGKEVEIGEISGGKRKVGPQVFNKVPVQRAPRSSPAPQVNDGSNINVQNGGKRNAQKQAPSNGASQNPSSTEKPPIGPTQRPKPGSSGSSSPREEVERKKSKRMSEERPNQPLALFQDGERNAQKQAPNNRASQNPSSTEKPPIGPTQRPKPGSSGSSSPREEVERKKSKRMSEERPNQPLALFQDGERNAQKQAPNNRASQTPSAIFSPPPAQTPHNDRVPTQNEDSKNADRRVSNRNTKTPDPIENILKNLRPVPNTRLPTVGSSSEGGRNQPTARNLNMAVTT